VSGGSVGGSGGLEGVNAGPGGAYLSVCAVYRDEAPYLREWVAFHRVVGVERFFLYNNRSVDDHRAALAPFVADGSVEVTDWPDWPAQMQVYQDCLVRHRRDSRWIAFIDLDEFLFSPTGRPLPEVLRDYERWPGVGANWAVFGASGHRERPDGLVIESYTRRTGDPLINRHIKSVVNPLEVRAFCMPHFFMYRGGDGVAVDENGLAITGPPFSMTKSVSFEKLRVNHYATRSEEEFRRKLDRGPADSSRPKSGRMTEANIRRRLSKLDEVADETILAYVPRVKQMLQR
jgi:hypothetical protein